MNNLTRLLKLGRERKTLEAPFALGALQFECNICSAQNTLPARALERESGKCEACGAVVRFRAVVHHLSVGLFGESLPIARFPKSAAQLKGIGMSDAHMYAGRLAKALDYTNTYYHQEPRLDIAKPDLARFGGCDFVISSDVFEHVAPPISEAFHHLHGLLKPNGLLVMTVPFVNEGETQEHFPELFQYRIERRSEEYILFNHTRNGRAQEFHDLVFHGGPGSTLEMRVFSEGGLRRELESAGFRDITFHRAPCFERGIYWPCPFSVPITAFAS